MVTDVRDGVPGAAVRFLAHARPVVAATCRAIAPPHVDVEDAVQDALVRAWRGLGRLGDDANVVGWLREIARNETRRWLRRSRPAQPLDSAPEPMDLSSDADPVEVAAASELAGFLGDVIGGLSPRDRELLLGHHHDGRPLADLAREAGLSAGYVKVLLHDIRQRCRAALDATYGRALGVVAALRRWISVTEQTVAPMFGMILLLPALALLSIPTDLASAATMDMASLGREDARGSDRDNRPRWPAGLLARPSGLAMAEPGPVGMGPAASMTAIAEVPGLIGIGNPDGELPPGEVRVVLGSEGDWYYNHTDADYPSEADPAREHLPNEGRAVVAVDPT